MLTIDYKIRDKKEMPAVLRKNGFIPAVFYGKKQTSTSVSVPFSDFIKVWKKAGESTVITLKGTSGNFDTLIHDVWKDPVKDTPSHIDFYVFEKGKKLEVSIPLSFVGVSPAVKDLSGNLIKVFHEIKIEAAPENLPHEIEVDISSLVTFEDKILARDLKLPVGVSLVQDAEEVVAAVEQPKAEEANEPLAAPDLSSIEVVKKGKKDEEGTTGEAGAPEAK